MISFSLASEDINAASRPSANQADWDRSRAWDPASELVHCVPPGGDGVNEDAAEK